MLCSVKLDAQWLLVRSHRELQDTRSHHASSLTEQNKSALTHHDTQENHVINYQLLVTKASDRGRKVKDWMEACLPTRASARPSASHTHHTMLVAYCSDRPSDRRWRPYVRQVWAWQGVEFPICPLTCVIATGHVWTKCDNVAVTLACSCGQCVGL